MPPRQNQRGPQRGPANAVRQTLDAMREFFEAPYRPADASYRPADARPADPTAPPAPPQGYQQHPDGTVVAQGDGAIALALQRYCEGKGPASAAAISVTQLAGRYGATVVVYGLEHGARAVLSVLFSRGTTPKLVASMLDLAGLVRVVGQEFDEWCCAP